MAEDMAGRIHKARILVVDDEANARVSLGEALRLEEYDVATAASGEEALSLLEKSEPFDLVVLDLKMPGMDGLEVTEVLREEWPDTVIILLTAFGSLETAIRAIRQGAHDYLLKPAAIPEILESIRGGLNERQQEQKRQQLVNQLQQTLSELAEVEGVEGVGSASSPQGDRLTRAGEIVVDPQKHVATLNGEPLDLTPTEFKILTCLVQTPDQVWEPQELVRRAQGYETDAWGARAIIRVHIRRLRKKLEKDPSNPQYILNKRGVGYYFSLKGPGEE